MPHDFELSELELQNIPKTIEKLRNLLRWADILGHSSVNIRRKLKKALKINEERIFEEQFVNPKFPSNATIWYRDEFE